jgi:hypothetical protein
MHRSGVSRFIGLATPSIANPRDRPSFKARHFPTMAKATFFNVDIEPITMTDARWHRAAPDCSAQLRMFRVELAGVHR